MNTEKFSRLFPPQSFCVRGEILPVLAELFGVRHESFTTVRDLLDAPLDRDGDRLSLTVAPLDVRALILACS